MKQQIPIFVINLKKDIEKRTYMESVAKKLSLTFIFVDAVYGKDLSSTEMNEFYDEAKTKELLGRPLFPGEIGCALSHMKIYKQMITEDIPEAIILEDDNEIDPLIEEFMASLKNVPNHCDLLLLGYHRKFPSNKYLRLSFRGRVQISQNLKIVKFTELMHGTIGYMIRNNGAKKLYKELKSGITKPIDHYTGDEIYTCLYGLYPRCVKPHQEYQMHSSIMEERLKFMEENKKDIDANKNLSFKEKVKRVLEKLGILNFMQRINQKRTIFFQELKALPKRLRKPRQV